jgi:hypothetical protein
MAAFGAIPSIMVILVTDGTIHMDGTLGALTLITTVMVGAVDTTAEAGVSVADTMVAVCIPIEATADQGLEVMIEARQDTETAMQEMWADQADLVLQIQMV